MPNENDNPTYATAAKVWSRIETLNWRVIAAVVLLIISIYMRPWSSSTSSFSGKINIDCRYPTLIESWHIQTFRPKWFGMFGGPGSLTYRTKGHKAHQISIVDIDKRDIPAIRLRVDGKDFGFQPVELDDSVDCGIDEGRCMVLGFASTKIIVPPGKHVVKAEIASPDGTFQWGKERQRRVKLKIEECSWSKS